LRARFERFERREDFAQRPRSTSRFTDAGRLPGAPPPPPAPGEPGPGFGGVAEAAVSRRTTGAPASATLILRGSLQRSVSLDETTGSKRRASEIGSPMTTSTGTGAAVTGRLPIRSQRLT
jgi:hypothetical protein